MYLMSLNYTLKKGYNGKFCYVHFITLRIQFTILITKTHTSRVNNVAVNEEEENHMCGFLEQREENTAKGKQWDY